MLRFQVCVLIRLTTLPHIGMCGECIHIVQSHFETILRSTVKQIHKISPHTFLIWNERYDSMDYYSDFELILRFTELHLHQPQGIYMA